MRAAVYVRVSTDQQAEKGYSICTQLEACRKYALELGATSIENFVDNGYSGEFIDRPELTRLLERLSHKKFDAVIAYAPDRLARKTSHLLIISEEIAKSGAMRKFASVNFEATAEGELMYKFQGIVAEYEKEKIKERTMRGKRGKAAKGLVISNAKPFGFTYDSEKSAYLIKQTEAHLVRTIFDFAVKDKLGTARICKELNARGIPSPRGKNAWTASSVHRILTNTIYKGIIFSMKYRYEKTGLNKKKRTLRPESEWIPIRVPAIVDEKTWQAAQNQLKKNKDYAKRNLKRDYILNGLVHCAKCGRKMIISHSGFKECISYYACPGRKSSSSGREPCSARQIPTKILDEYIFDHLMKLFYNNNPDTIAEYIKCILDGNPDSKNEEKYQKALEEMAKTEKGLLEQKDTLLRWFRQKILAENEAENQLKGVQDKLADIVKMKRIYEEKLSSLACAKSSFRLNLEQCDFAAAAKRLALQAIVGKVIAERIDDTRGRGSRPELDVELRLK